MQAQLTQDGEVLIVKLSGHVDFETATPFREACLNRLNGQKIVFDFNSLSFVGSSGILPFIETIEEFAKLSAHPFKLSGLSSEFKKVFASTSMSGMEMFDTASQAVRAFTNPAPQVVYAAPLTQSPPKDEVSS